MNNRRKLVIALGAGAITLPFPCFTQQPKPARVSWFSFDRGGGGSPFFDAFRAGLSEMGYVEGRNLILEAYWGEGSAERTRKLAAELAQSKPDVMVVQGGTALLPLYHAGAAMPVVFSFSGDPVEAKVVDSLARPGRNFTGVSFLSLELAGKRMELLKESLPRLKRVAILANPEHPGEQSELRVSRNAAKTLGLALDYFRLRNDQDLEDAFAGILKSRSEAVMVFPDALVMRYRERIAAFAMKTGVPTISGWGQFAEGGNLMSYAPNLRDSYRRLATYVDKVLKGTKPSDIPVELPTTVELIVNLRTAKALGIKIPNSILVRADKVIE
ncbi:MAG: ABC transporter substrate-binding protein [Betaproteobacteria bacterium]|nr:ABC transporter substrate-binding protein [Betaproteobacteria bacterium]